ncbi:MAG: hypothetical protein IIB17_10040, partial [Chloroflexi bacterium]|nr:hypothetical protein [Chloroflexota bacterium]
MSKQREQPQTTAGPRPGGWSNLLAFAIGAVAVVMVLALAMVGDSPAVHAEESEDIRCLAD